MAAVPLADAARLLGKPERTIRRWAAQGKLPATRTADGWLVEITTEVDGQVAATDRIDGHSSGHVAAPSSATGGQMAAVPVAYLRELQGRAEMAAFWQGRSTILEARVQQLEGQIALPPPMPEIAPGRPTDVPSVETTQTSSAAHHARRWWLRWLPN